MMTKKFRKIRGWLATNGYKYRYAEDGLQLKFKKGNVVGKVQGVTRENDDTVIGFIFNINDKANKVKIQTNKTLRVTQGHIVDTLTRYLGGA